MLHGMCYMPLACSGQLELLLLESVDWTRCYSGQSARVTRVLTYCTTKHIMPQSGERLSKVDPIRGMIRHLSLAWYRPVWAGS